MPLQLLPATADDRELIAALVAHSNAGVAARFGLTEANCPKHPSFCTPDWIAEENARGQRYVLARVDGEAAGCVALDFPAEPGTVYLNRLSVLPPWRRRGVGRALSEAVLAAAAGWGATRVSIGVIAAHGELVRWYEHQGFVAGATRRFEHLPFEVLYMTRELAPVAPVPLFDTERLHCRRWRPEDHEALQQVYGDADAMRWAGDGRGITPAECEAWRRVTAINDATRGYGMATLERRSDGRIVGFCGLVHPGGQVEPEAKYAFAREHWGQGLASEALQGLLAWADARGIGPVIATVAEPNLASRRVIEKAGLHCVERRDEDDGIPSLVYARPGG